MGDAVEGATTVRPVFMQPGSEEYRKHKVQWLQSQLMYVRGDCEPFAESADEFRQSGEFAYYIDGEENWDRFCREVLETEPVFVNNVITGVYALKGRGYTGPMGADEDGTVKPLGKPGNPTGANQHSGEGEGKVRNYEDTSGERHDDATYIDARLARDADPEASPLEAGERERVAAIKERRAAGELSANKAAIEAGYRKKRCRVDQFKSLWRNASEEERAAMEEFIGEWRRSEVPQ